MDQQCNAIVKCWTMSNVQNVNVWPVSVTQFRLAKISKFFCKTRTVQNIQNRFPWHYIWLSRIFQFSWSFWTNTET